MERSSRMTSDDLESMTTSDVGSQRDPDAAPPLILVWSGAGNERVETIVGVIGYPPVMGRAEERPYLQRGCRLDGLRVVVSATERTRAGSARVRRLNSWRALVVGRSSPGRIGGQTLGNRVEGRRPIGDKLE
jgi:hypothetical protein